MPHPGGGCALRHPPRSCDCAKAATSFEPSFAVSLAQMRREDGVQRGTPASLAMYAADQPRPHTREQTEGSPPKRVLRFQWASLFVQTGAVASPDLNAINGRTTGDRT